MRKDGGLHGLYDRSRLGYLRANKLPYQVDRAIIGLNIVDTLRIEERFPAHGHDFDSDVIPLEKVSRSN